MSATTPLPSSFFRLTHDFAGAVRIPALRHPTYLELRSHINWVREENNISDLSPEGEVVFGLGTVLADGEETISGLEYERRIARSLQESLVLGCQHWNHFQRNHALLVAVPPEVVYIDFPGIIVSLIFDASELPSASKLQRNFPCLVRDGKDWSPYWRSLGRHLNRYGRIAVSYPLP